MTPSNIDVIIGTGRVPISHEVFTALLENSVVHGRAPYRKALKASSIHYSELVALARKAEIPHPLFFAPPELVQEQIRKKNEKLLQGVAPSTFTVSTRTAVELRDVELIVKDLLRKQNLARKHAPGLQRNRILGLLRQPRRTVREDAEALLDAIGLDRREIRESKTKEAALELIISRLEENQVLVSRSVRGFMPQLIEVRFSGMTVRDSKVPYIFLAGGDHLDFQEPTGRQIFTLVLMAVLVGRGIFEPVSFDAQSIAPAPGREYDIVGEVLMPETDLREISLRDLDDLKAVSDQFKVTPSAIAVRAMRLGRLSPEETRGHLDALETEFRAIPKNGPRHGPKPVNAIRKYSGRFLASSMLRAVDQGRLSPGDFCRVVCLNRIRPHDLDELRAALR
ncbi:hypothetical protein [Brachybacterium hainanense]|uniref:Uncharacterized protein n=1 Tax=Brachybacterium hainanense TaxID=1541174 RepID=A0ABV6RDX1_9MICO